MSVTTMTTVGYGDITPPTTGGKVIAVVVMLAGIGTATLVMEAVAQRFIATRTGSTIHSGESDDEDVLASVSDAARQLQETESLLGAPAPALADPRRTRSAG